MRGKNGTLMTRIRQIITGIRTRFGEWNSNEQVRGKWKQMTRIRQIRTGIRTSLGNGTQMIKIIGNWNTDRKELEQITTYPPDRTGRRDHREQV
jgi:hypothetical protein